MIMIAIERIYHPISPKEVFDVVNRVPWHRKGLSGATTISSLPKRKKTNQG
jgi:hypothetical protein